MGLGLLEISNCNNVETLVSNESTDPDSEAKQTIPTASNKEEKPQIKPSIFSSIRRRMQPKFGQ